MVQILWPGGAYCNITECSTVDLVYNRQPLDLPKVAFCTNLSKSCHGIYLGGCYVQGPHSRTENTSGN